MKKVMILLLAFLSLSAMKQETKPTVKDFGWLAGCWERGGEGWRGVEQWMKPDGGAMFGMSRTVVQGKTREFEFLQLREQENGDLFYISLPSGQKEARFKLIEFEDRKAVFENKAHDFPQRIIYHLKEDGILAAFIEGEIQGKTKSVDFTMRRVNCD